VIILGAINLIRGEGLWWLADDQISIVTAMGRIQFLKRKRNICLLDFLVCEAVKKN
jgi:hypothetical protein